MASISANQENSDSDSSWTHLTDEVCNSSIKGGTPKETNLDKIDDGEMKKSSSFEEFEVIDHIESPNCDDKSNDDDSDSSFKEADEEENLNNKPIITPDLSREEFEVIEEEKVLPPLPTTQNLEQIVKERNEKLGSLYKPISKYLLSSNNDNGPYDKFLNKNIKKSIIYSDDASWKESNSIFQEGLYYRTNLRLLARCRYLRYKTMKLQYHRSVLLFTIGISLLAVAEMIRTVHSEASKAFPKERTLTPVKTSHLGWDALTEEFEPVLNMLNDRPDLDDEEECPACNVNFEEKKKQLRGISFKMLENDMMISIGVDERKTFVIYEKNGVIDVKMIPENLRNDTKLLFTLPEEILMTELMDFCPFLRFVRLTEKVIDSMLIALLLFVKILLGIAIAFFRVLFWCIDFYMKHLWKIFRWQ